MRKNFGPKTWFYPLPVLIIGTYNEDGSPNAMNAAWGGIVDYNQVQVNLAMHKTTKNIQRGNVFTLSFATKESVVAADYVGIVSGDKVPDKVARAGLHVTKAQTIDAPLFDELPLALECEVVSINDNLQVVANVKNVSADESILDEAGNIDLTKLHIITYDPVGHTYIELGNEVAKAFNVGKNIK